MKTLLRLGPSDHGRPISLEEFEHAAGEEGYNYELIRGRVYVSPKPNPTHDFFVEWFADHLRDYSLEHADTINYISRAARTFVPEEAEISAPEPDLTVYSDYPIPPPLGRLRWQDLHPFLVVEILSEDDPDKDLERNVELYLQVRSIEEYWVLDPRDPDHLVFHAYRRHGRRWRLKTLHHGDAYTTRMLPGFSLTIDPRA